MPGQQPHHRAKDRARLCWAGVRKNFVSQQGVAHENDQVVVAALPSVAFELEDAVVVKDVAAVAAAHADVRGENDCVHYPYYRNVHYPSTGPTRFDDAADGQCRHLRYCSLAPPRVAEEAWVVQYWWLWVFPKVAYQRQPEPRLAFAPRVLVLEAWVPPSFVVGAAAAVVFVGAVFHFVVVVAVEAASIVAAAANDANARLGDATRAASVVAVVGEACWEPVQCSAVSVVVDEVVALAAAVELEPIHPYEKPWLKNLCLWDDRRRHDAEPWVVVAVVAVVPRPEEPEPVAKPGLVGVPVHS